MTQYVYALLVVAFFVTIGFTGELKGFLRSQWSRVKSFTWVEWTLGLALVIGTGIASHYLVEWLSPVIPVLAQSEAEAAARAGAHSTNKLHYVAGFVISLGCMLVVNGISNTVTEWFGEEWGWVSIVRNLVICLLLNWVISTTLSFLVWYCVQTAAASLIFGAAWATQRQLKRDDPRQGAAKLTGNSVGAQFFLMFLLLTVADILVLILI